MKTVRPKPFGAVSSLKLTPEEGFVLSRIDGQLSVRDLVALTGMDQPRIEQIVTKLASHGAVALESADASSGYLPADTGSSPSLTAAAAAPAAPAHTPASGTRAAASRPRIERAPREQLLAPAPAVPPDEGTTSLAEFAAALGMDPSAFAAAETPPAPAVEERVPPQRIESKSSYPPPAMMAELEELQAVVDEPALAPPQARSAERHYNAAGEPLDELIPVPDDGQAAEGEAAADGDGEAAAEGEPVSAEDAEAAVVAERNYRQLYEAKYHPLPTDARVKAAQTVSGADLMALCFDADPRVIAAILENHTHGLEQVRLIAFHHRTGTGLEMISRRTEYLRDILTERRLLKNPQAGDTVIGRIMASKKVFQTYKIAIDREVPELTRVKARGFLRKKFQTAPPEERADLVIRTEGRCLILMTGCTFDAKTTGILCGRPYNSVLFIQNLAKFAATPPGLLAHLMKQPFVRKNAPLRKLLLQHPNMPGEVKRQF